MASSSRPPSASSSPNRSGSQSSLAHVTTLHTSLRASIEGLARQQQATAELVAQLQQSRAQEQAHADGILATLGRLKSHRMTISALQTTQVGQTVNKLRKHESQPIASASSELVKAWKAVADTAGRAVDAAGCVDASGKGKAASPRRRDPVDAEALRKLRVAEKLSVHYKRLEDEKQARKIVALDEAEAERLRRKRMRR